MTMKQPSSSKTCVFLLLVSISLMGCGKSDAARMEAFRKYAGAGGKDDEETAPITPISRSNSTPFVAPARNQVGAKSDGATSSVESAATPSGNQAARNSSAPDQPAPAIVNGMSDTKTPPATPSILCRACNAP